MSAAPTPTATPGPSSPDYTWAIVAYGVGAAGIATGATFGIMTLVKKGDLEEDCPDKVCPEGSSADIDAAERDALISTIGFGVGIAGVGLGTYLLLTADGSPETQERVARSRRGLEPWLGFGSAGVRGRF